MRDKKRKERAMLQEAYQKVNEMLGPHNNPYPQKMAVAVPVPSEDESCGEYDQSEIDMAGRDLLKAQEYATKLSMMVPKLPGLDGWVASKITKAADYLSSVFHYLDYEMQQHDEVVVDVEEIQAPVEVFNVGYEDTENT
tara:strand:+ start:153 stop:569 length:417 start_codon:yes stop_codon:yes gene_type:complete